MEMVINGHRVRLVPHSDNYWGLVVDGVTWGTHTTQFNAILTAVGVILRDIAA